MKFRDARERVLRLHLRARANGGGILARLAFHVHRSQRFLAVLVKRQFRALVRSTVLKFRIDANALMRSRASNGA
jgi:hypothetical protein